MFKILTALTLVLLIIQPAQAIKIDNNQLFPAVAQGHSCQKEQLDMDDSGNQINGAFAPLDFCSFDDLEGTCDGEKCEITGRNNVSKLQLNGDIFNEPKNNTKNWPNISDGTYTLEAGKYALSESDINGGNKFTIYALGDVEIYIKEDFKLQDKSFVINSKNGVIDFYFKKSFELQDANVHVDGDVRFFVKDNNKESAVDFQNTKTTKELGSQVSLYSKGGIKIQKESQFDGYLYSGGVIDLQDTTKINGRVTAQKLEMEDEAIINDAGQGGLVDQCFIDYFDRSGLDGTWAVTSSKGNFTPKLINERFRLTTADTQQATSVTYLSAFPSAKNHFVIEFDHFAYDGSGADGIALVLSDKNAKVLPGSYGGPLGYGSRANNNIDGFNGGWLGIGIDEYGNFVREGGGNSLNSRKKHTVAIRGAGSGTQGYDLLASYTDADTPIHSGNNSNRPHRYRIRINFKSAHQAQVTISRRVNFNGEYAVLIDETITQEQSVPEELLLSITGSTGSSTSIHEIDNTLICATDIKIIPPPPIDHFRFDIVEATAQSCGVQKVELMACVNADDNCAEKYDQSIAATLVTSPSMVWRGGNGMAFAGTKIFDLKGASGSIKLDVASSNPQAKLYSTTLCQIAGRGFSENNCAIEYSGEGEVLNFTINDDYVYAGAVATAILAPQEKCKALYQDVEKEVTFTAISENPQDVEYRPDLFLTIDDKEHELKQSTADTSNPLTKTVKFDENGQANIQLRYPEAGKTKIAASINDAIGADNLITLPKGLCVKSAGECSAANASCAPFVAAGQPFDLTVTAHGLPLKNNDICSGPVLQNYVQDISLSANLIAPKSGVAGVLEQPSYRHNATEEVDTATHDQGINTVRQSVSEVGVFEITATPNGNYHGIDATQIKAGTSAALGRFYPAQFVLERGEVIATHSGDNKESYMDQPFNINFTLSAVNTSGKVVENYIGDFIKSQVSLAALVNNRDAKNRLNTPIDVSNSQWADGVLTWNTQTAFKRNEDKPDGPFVLDVKLDFDAGEAGKIVPLQDDRTTNQDNNCNPVSNNCLLLGQQEVRHGRLLATTVSQTVNSDASVPLKIQYWDSAEGDEGDWKLFEGDNWTVLQKSQIDFTGNSYPNSKLIFGLGQGEAINPDTLNTIMVKGETKLNVAAPNIVVQIPYRVVVPIWLEDGKANEGSINFGQPKGNSSVIYRREQFN
ncbi:DUF6701 domain-containing protein [Oceanisphaera sp. W20_SRM_FM3]|uniref:DUF6701 domain-containing protein n=1 Tax=Oceanisphaera sp. W20_SRM_FM3 TaxID=3240267 RepID=UPI003F9D39AC